MRLKDIILTSRKVLSILLGIAASVCLVACSDDEPKDRSELITMWVSAETTTVYDEWLDSDLECMLVKFSPNSEWEPMPMGKIQGFTYEDGVEYELSVYRTTLANPPADGPIYTYRLDRIISRSVVTVYTQGLDDYIEVPAEGKDFSIEFTSNSPCEIARIVGSIFGDVSLQKKSDSNYSLLLKIPENIGMGRVKKISLRFGNGEEKNIGIWQMPRKFNASETFEMPYSGCLGYMIGSDESNYGKIRNVRIVGMLNTNDCYYLKRILESNGYQGNGEKPEYTIDLSQSGFVTGKESHYSDCNICNVPSDYLPTVFTNDVPAGVFTSNKYLTEVILPEGIEMIDPSAFSHCTALTTVNIPSSCTEIGSNAFKSCESLKNVLFPYISQDIDLPHLQKIGQYAFYGTGRLNSFVLPESLKVVETTSLSFYVDKLFCLTEEPPVWEIPGNAGYVLGPKPDGCTLYVPYGCSEAYKASEKWGKFKIVEMPEDKWWEMIP